MPRMRIQIIGSKLGSTTNNDITQLVRSSDPGELVPGVTDWASVSTRTFSGVQVYLFATIDTDDTVIIQPEPPVDPDGPEGPEEPPAPGDPVEVPVDLPYLHSYIMGKGEFWLNGDEGSMLSPEDVVLLG